MDSETPHKEEDTTATSNQQHSGKLEEDTGDHEEFRFDRRYVTPDGTPFTDTMILFERHMAKLKPQTPEDIARICAEVGVPADRAMEIVRKIEEETARDLDEAIREQEERELLEQAAEAEQREK